VLLKPPPGQEPECFDRPLPRKSFGACGTDITFCIISQHFVLGDTGFRSRDDFNTEVDAWIFLTESFDCFLISSLFVGSKLGGQPEFELSLSISSCRDPKARKDRYQCFIFRFHRGAKKIRIEKAISTWIEYHGLIDNPYN
jgi:hypothetical protein